MKLLSAILSGILAVSAAASDTETDTDTRKEISTKINSVEYVILVNSDGKTAELKSVYLPYSYAEADVPAEIEGYKITAKYKVNGCKGFYELLRTERGCAECSHNGYP